MRSGFFIFSLILLCSLRGLCGEEDVPISLSTPKAFEPPRPINVITYEKEALISGIRIENLEGAEKAFLGYTSRGASIVLPDHDVRVVLFGMWLEELQTVAFTTTENCSAASLVFEQADFTSQSDKRVVIVTSFPDIALGEFFRVCIKSHPKYNRFPAEYVQVSEFRTRISTEIPPRQYYFPLWIQIIIIACLLVLSGLFSGLNLGLMSLTPQELMLIQKSGSKNERKYADVILPVRARGNLLLCSLLIGNVCVNSGISILLDDLTSGYVALIASSAGIVVFGEIFPQSLCVKKGLAVGAYTIWVTRFFMIATFPIAYPISKILDFVLGEEVVSYDRKRLMELIKMSNEKGLGEELKIAVGAMEISDKTVTDVMTRIDDVFMLPNTTVLNTKTVAEILRMGYTRIPVFSGDRNNVVSLLFVKDLALLDPDDNFTIQTVCGYHQHPLRFVMEDTPLRVMLEEFKKADLSCLMDADEPTRVISVQMQLVTLQWLTTNHKAFSPDLISQSVLEKLIRQHCRRVELSHLPDMYEPKAVVPRTAKLYTKQEYSEKFILILEGRALVTIGQDEMMFEAGPWFAFGTEMLERLVAKSEADSRAMGDVDHSRNSLVSDTTKKLGFIPDYTVVVRDECTFLEITAHSWVLACRSTLMSRGGI
ncbi:Metal transporter cnnm-1, partial [Trichostrongylus colubriformis]